MKIEIIKKYKLLTVGQKIDIDSDYCKRLIDKGFAKSLEVVKEVAETEKVKEVEPKATKKVK